MDVYLSWVEFRRAAKIGVDRYTRARALSRTPTNGQAADDWIAHQLGALGECVIAKQAGLYWPLDNDEPDRGRADVGPWHVRTTRMVPPRLILTDRDGDADPYVLVTPLGLPRFQIVGWCYAYEGKQPEYRGQAHGRPPAYFVPETALRPWGAEVKLTDTACPS